MNNSSQDCYQNPMGTDGFEFLEFAPANVEQMALELTAMGFAAVAKHKKLNITLYKQGDINFLLNNEPASMGGHFKKIHGPSVSGMAFRVHDAQLAYERALRLGARAYQGEFGQVALDVPIIYGIGESLLYFIDQYQQNTVYLKDFNPLPSPTITTANGVGLTYLDHVTHNVFRGHMDVWARYYQELFNFRQIRYFDIKGKKTGLISRAMTSPCGKIRIPLNESTDDKSQIEEYLQQYNGEGIQHIALGSADIYHSVETMRLNGIKMLTVPDTYYELIDKRLPGHGENILRLFENKILIDGNLAKNEGLLLQIFTQNMLGPVFFEFIQRKGNEGFGEGNFQALFEAMELDQMRRGVL